MNNPDDTDNTDDINEINSDETINNNLIIYNKVLKAIDKGVINIDNYKNYDTLLHIVEDIVWNTSWSLGERTNDQLDKYILNIVENIFKNK